MSETAPASNALSQSKLFTALAKAQAKFVQPEKNKEVEVFKDGRLLYKTKYADLKNVVESFRSALTEFGVSFAQKTRQAEKGWRLVLIVRHESGEFDESEMPINLEGVAPQQIGSQLTYLKRYQAAAYFGIAADDDDDANGAHGNQANFGDRKPKGQRGEGAPKSPPKDLPTQQQKPPADPAKGKMATTAEITALTAKCAELGVSVEEQKAMLQTKIGRPSWKDLTAVELLRAKEGVAELEREVSTRSTTDGMTEPPPDYENESQDPGPLPDEKIPEDDLDAALGNAMAKDEPRPPAKLFVGRPSDPAPKADLDALWELGISRGFQPKEITDLVVARVGKQEWSKLTNFQATAVKNAIDSKGAR